MDKNFLHFKEKNFFDYIYQFNSHAIVFLYLALLSVVFTYWIFMLVYFGVFFFFFNIIIIISFLYMKRIQKVSYCFFDLQKCS